MSICKLDDLLDISNSTCIPKLLESRPSKCNYTNSHHVPTVSEISEGLILLNQYDGSINTGNETQGLNGTYLIKFNNMTISVNNRKFVSKEKSTVHALPAILQPKPDEDEFKETLSLQMMEEMHLNNTKHIGLLETETFTQKIWSWGPLSLVVIIIITLAAIRCKKDKKLKILNTTNIGSVGTVEPHHRDEEIGCATLAAGKPKEQISGTAPPQRRKFYETPFF